MEACSEKRGMAALASPRISFSHDLSTTETHRLDSSLPLDSHADDFDFDFSLSVGISADDGSSLADELFSGGKLLPLPIKNPSAASNPPPLPPPPTIPYPKKNGSLREIMSSSEDDNGAIKRSPSSSQKSFWRFRRSSSLNCSGGSRSRPGLLCPFALLRSKSTGSSPTPNPRRPDKQHKKTNQTNNPGGSGINSSPLLLHKFSTDSNARIYYHSGTRRSCRNGVRITPVLNVPTASSAFCYLLCSCGDKSTREGDRQY